MIKRSLFAVVLLASVSMPVAAQDIATRIFQMEERIRQLTGQVEELNFTVQQLQKKLGQQGDAGEVMAQPPQRKALAEAAPLEDGVEVIQDPPMLVSS